MPMSRGQTWVLNSLTVHADGGCPAGAPYRCVAFSGVAFFPASYEMTQAVLLPFWAGSPGTTLACGRDGCRLKVSRKSPQCFGCSMQFLCAKHKGDLCSACERGDLTTSLPAIPAPEPQPHVPIECMIHCLVPGSWAAQHCTLSMGRRPHGLLLVHWMLRRARRIARAPLGPTRRHCCHGRCQTICSWEPTGSIFF